MEYVNQQSVIQYQSEERARLARRIKHSRYILKDLFDTMEKEELSTPEKVISLREDLAKHHNEPKFLKCKTMAQLLKRNFMTLKTHMK
jgi:hypothetical protein